jgi:hypothetical protein
VSIVLGTLLVACLAVGAGAWLRRLGVPGAAAVGGLLVGLLLGPGGFGRTHPEWQVAIFEGDPAVLEAIAIVDREEAALAFAAAQPSSIGASTSDALAELEARRAAAVEAWREERERHRLPLSLATLAAAAFLLFAGGCASAVRGPMRRHQSSEALLQAAWLVLVPCAATLATLAIAGREFLAPSSLAMLAIVSVGAWAVERGDRRIAGDATREGPSLLEAANRWATAAGLLVFAAAVGVSFFHDAPPLDADRRALLAGLAVVALAAPLGWWAAQRIGTGTAAALRLRGRVAGGAEFIALPCAIAWGLLWIEPFAHAGILLSIAIYVIAEDVRWVAGCVGHWTIGRERGLRALRLALAGLSLAPTMAALSAAAIATGVLEPTDALALFVAATVIALLTNYRRSAADELADLEQELDERTAGTAD